MHAYHTYVRYTKAATRRWGIGETNRVLSFSITRRTYVTYTRIRGATACLRAFVHGFIYCGVCGCTAGRSCWRAVELIKASPDPRTPAYVSGPDGPNMFTHPMRYPIHPRSGRTSLFPQTRSNPGEVLCGCSDRCHTRVRHPRPTQNPLPRPCPFPPEAVALIHASLERQLCIDAGSERT